MRVRLSCLSARVELGFTESGLQWYETTAAKAVAATSVAAVAAKLSGVFN
jgi:hypothetical protein